jgi:hypothetical protein
MTMDGTYTLTMTQPRDFSLPMEPKPFRLAPDDFTAPALLPPMVLKRLAAMHSELGDVSAINADNMEQILNRIGDMFALLLPGQPGERFRARLLTDGGPESPPPIDLVRQALPVLYWLMEEYGLRPTQPSSPSPVGSTDATMDIPNGGTSSTDGASPTESIT